MFQIRPRIRCVIDKKITKKFYIVNRFFRSEKFKDKNRTYKGKINEYKIKQIVKISGNFVDYLTITKSHKRFF